MTEIVGRNLLVSHLLAGGIEVARPERDRGIDLIAYLDRLDSGFVACPIQMKANRGQAFSIFKKYEKTKGILNVFVWNVGDPSEAEIYATTQAQSLAIAEAHGWTKTSSWIDKGVYVSTSPSASLRQALESYRMSPARWAPLIRGVSA